MFRQKPPLPRPLAGKSRRCAVLSLLLPAIVGPPALHRALAAEAPAAPQTPVIAGFGTIRFDGLSQNWFVYSDRAPDTFRIRRLELRFTGQITPKVSWTGMIDAGKILAVNQGPPVAANQRTRALQDAVVMYTVNPHLRLDVGQEKIPLSQEGLQPVAQLDTVERALFMSGPRLGGTPGLGDARSIGVQARWGLGWADAHVALTNGVGEEQNATDLNNRKDLIARFVARPRWVPGLQVGASGALSGGFGTAHLKRDRAGAEALFSRGPWLLKSEIMSGRDQAAAGGPIFNRLGWYAHAGYKSSPQWEWVARYDVWDPDEEGAAGATPMEHDALAGANYYIRGHNAKIQLNLIRKAFSGPQPTEYQVLTNWQAAW